jgi:hypothetical protein
MAVKDIYSHTPATPSKSSKSGGPVEYRGSNRPPPKAPKRESGAGRVSFGGGSMSRPVGGKKVVKRYV